MWHQTFLLAAFVSVAQGLCNGGPMLQQPLPCLPPKIYSPQTCDCLEPAKEPRGPNETNGVDGTPAQSSNYVDPVQVFKNKLNILRRRLSIGLPDAAGPGERSSVGNVHTPLAIQPDGPVMSYSGSKLSSSSDQVPRSWSLRPTSPAMTERLRAARNMWKTAIRSRAIRGFGNSALAQKFLNNLPVGSAAPESRNQFHLEAQRVPSGPGMRGSPAARTAKEGGAFTTKARKAPLSKFSAGRTKSDSNSYTRSLLRLRPSTGTFNTQPN